MSNEGKYPSAQSITTPNVEDKLQAILAEYNALRSEIQNRSNSQSHILEIHLTILALIIGFITTRPEYLKFLILVIPIESSIFGLWYLFHKSSIEEIGCHIRNKIEPRVNGLVRCKAMLWEKEGVRDITKSLGGSFKTFESITFAAPSILALIILASIIIGFFGIAEICINEPTTFFVVIIGLIIDLSILLTYIILKYKFEARIKDLKNKEP